MTSVRASAYTMIVLATPLHFSLPLSQTSITQVGWTSYTYATTHVHTSQEGGGMRRGPCLGMTAIALSLALLPGTFWKVPCPTTLCCTSDAACPILLVSAVLCHAVLCHAMLCRAVLCHAMPCRAMLCCAHVLLIAVSFADNRASPKPHCTWLQLYPEEHCPHYDLCCSV